MYDIYTSLTNINSEYIVFNSLEVGSLPEIYHFHIGKNVISNEIDKLLPDENQLYSKINKSSQLVEHQVEHPFVDSYIFNLNFKRILMDILPIFLYKLRKGSDNNKYTSQLFFFKKNNKEYLMISFRRVALNKIQLISNKLSDDYYDELFGKSNLHGIIYIPLGIINYKTKTNKSNTDIITDITSKLNDLNIINEFKLKFHHHPDFDKLLQETLTNMNEQNMISELESKNDYCFNLKNNNLLEDSKIKCNILPILYKLAPLNIIGTELENGRLLVENSAYYYIKVDIASDTVITYFNTYVTFDNEAMLTLYKKIFNESNNCNYYLFNPVKTTVDVFCELDKEKFRNNPELIHSIIVILIYKFIILHKNNIRCKNISLKNIFVVDNNIILKDYYFNDNIIVSISKNYNVNCKFKVFHQGNDYFFSFGLIKETYSELELISDIKTFIVEFHNLIGSYNIQNLLLTDIYTLLNQTIISGSRIQDIVNKFKFMTDIFTCKSSKYKIFETLKKIGYLDDLISPDEYNYYNFIKQKLDIDGNFLSQYKIISAPVEYFISGISDYKALSNEYLMLELKPFTYINPIWLNSVNNITDNYLQNFFSPNGYFRWNSTSRFLLYKSTANKAKIIEFNRTDLKSYGNKHIRLPSTINKGDVANDINFYKNIINRLYVFNETQKNALEVIYNSITKKFDVLTLQQDLLNFGIGIKYPNIDGYKIYIDADFNQEYVFINPQKSITCICIAKLYKSYFKVFFDYKSYLNDINLIDFEDYYDKYNSNEKKIILIDTVKSIIKTSKEYKYNLADNLADNLTFYNRPQINPIVINIDDTNKYPMLGGDYLKYLKYKHKYLQLKKLLI